MKEKRLHLITFTISNLNIKPMTIDIGKLCV